jgi:hypothetical protein
MASIFDTMQVQPTSGMQNYMQRRQQRQQRQQQLRPMQALPAEQAFQQQMFGSTPDFAALQAQNDAMNADLARQRMLAQQQGPQAMLGQAQQNFPGMGLGQAAQAGGLGSFLPQQPMTPEMALRQQQLLGQTPMGPGAGLNQQNPYAGMSPQLRQAVKQAQNMQMFQSRIADKVSNVFNTMGPGAGMAPERILHPWDSPSPNIAGPMGAERQAQLLNMPQNNPYAAYMTPTQSQSVDEMRAIMTNTRPRQIGTMGPGAGMAPTQTGLGAQGTLVPPMQNQMPMTQNDLQAMLARQNAMKRNAMKTSGIGTTGPGSGLAPGVGGI